MVSSTARLQKLAHRPVSNARRDERLREGKRFEEEQDARVHPDAVDASLGAKALASDLKEEKKKVARLEAEIEAMQLDERQLTTELEHLKSASAKTASQYGQLDLAQARVLLLELNQKVADQIKQLKVAQEKVIHLESKLQAMQEENEVLRARLASGGGPMPDTEKERQQKKQEHDSRQLNHLSQNVVPKLEGKIIKLEAERDNLEGTARSGALKLTQLEKAKEKLEGEQSALNQKVAKLEVELEKSKKEAKSSAKVLELESELDAAYEQVRQLKGQVSKLESAQKTAAALPAAAWEREKKQLREETKNLQADLDAARSKLSEKDKQTTANLYSTKTKAATNANGAGACDSAATKKTQTELANLKAANAKLTEAAKTTDVELVRYKTMTDKLGLLTHEVNSIVQKGCGVPANSSVLTAWAREKDNVAYWEGEQKSLEKKVKMLESQSGGSAKKGGGESKELVVMKAKLGAVEAKLLAAEKALKTSKAAPSRSAEDVIRIRKLEDEVEELKDGKKEAEKKKVESEKQASGRVRELEKELERKGEDLRTLQAESGSKEKGMTAGEKALLSKMAKDLAESNRLVTELRKENMNYLLQMAGVGVE